MKTPLWRKYLICYLVIALGAVVYLSSNWFFSRFAAPIPPTAIDRLMPFWPATIFVYSLIFLLIAAAPFLLNTEILFRRTIFAFLVLLGLNVALFAVCPVASNLRPEIATLYEPWQMIYRQVYAVDTSANCFPSFHVSLATLIGFTFLRTRPKVFRALVGPLILIALSTMTTKQHYFYDVLGGFLLGYLVYRISLVRYPLTER
jgi:membrane-associated phospholipid phosphatase